MSKRHEMGISPPPAYDMAAPNAGLPYRNGLPELCLPAAATKRGQQPPAVPRWAFTDGPKVNTWLDPELLEGLLDGDERLAGAIEGLLDGGKSIKAGTKGEARAVAALEKHVRRVFEQKLLVDVIEKFEAVLPLVLRYVLAKGAARLRSPGRFVEEVPEAAPGVDDGEDDQEIGDD